MLERYLGELWTVLLDLSPALLLGLALAGLLRAYLPERVIRTHLSPPTLGSAVRAALIGVPMPLCSCGVVPTAIGLRNQGASKGATLSFLISTPQTGVDSILVSAALLGWPFALFKLVAAFVTGVFGGWLADRVTTAAQDPTTGTAQGQPWTTTGHRLVESLRYALFDILASIDRWLIAGVLLAALITTLLPAGSLEQLQWTQGLGGMLLVLAISLPLYVCTTSSVPIAASLIAAGMPAGTALVFLMAGPATNIATIGALYRTLGGRLLGIYLGTVIVASIGLGMGFDFVLGPVTEMTATHRHDSVAWWETASALLLIGLLVYLSARRLLKENKPAETSAEASNLTLKVGGMVCASCAADVRASLEALDQVDSAIVDLRSGLVEIKGDDLHPDRLVAAITRAGFTVTEKTDP